MGYPESPPLEFKMELHGREIGGDVLDIDGDEPTLIEIGCGYGSLFFMIGGCGYLDYYDCLEILAESKWGHLVTPEPFTYDCETKEELWELAESDEPPDSLTVTGNGILVEHEEVRYYEGIAASDVTVFAEYLPEEGLPFDEYYQELTEYDTYDELWGPVKRVVRNGKTSHYAWVDVKYTTAGFKQDDLVLFRQVFERLGEEDEQGRPILHSDQALARVIGRVVECSNSGWAYVESSPEFVLLVYSTSTNSLMTRFGSPEEMTKIERGPVLEWFLSGAGDSQTIHMLQHYGSLSNNYIEAYLEPDGSLMTVQDTSSYAEIRDRGSKRGQPPPPSPIVTPWSSFAQGRRRNVGK